MSEPAVLETPLSPVFTIVGSDEGFEHRPLMTGDVLERPDGTWVVLLQHPCAMRAGSSMVERLLACEVDTAAVDLRSKWHSERHYRMSLVELGEGHAADFNLPVIVASADARLMKRIAIMDRAGVNLLLQRWVHHNSRVIIKTITYDEQSAGPYAEADLFHEGVTELVDAGHDSEVANEFVENFLASPVGNERHDTWRARLRHPQHHSSVRRELDLAVQKLIEDTNFADT